MINNPKLTQHLIYIYGQWQSQPRQPPTCILVGFTTNPPWRCQNYVGCNIKAINCIDGREQRYVTMSIGSFLSVLQLKEKVKTTWCIFFFDANDMVYRQLMIIKQKNLNKKIRGSQTFSIQFCICQPFEQSINRLNQNFKFSRITWEHMLCSQNRTSWNIPKKIFLMYLSEFQVEKSAMNFIDRDD